MQRLIPIAIVAALAVLGGWYFLGRTPADAFAECRTGNVAGGDLGGPFQLVNSAGDQVTDTDVITGPSLLYFGYTYCPDVCPLDVARNAEAIALLEERGIEVTPVFISVDPERDTPEQIGDFAHNMHPRMIGLTGSEDQVKAASQAYKTYFRKQEEGDPDYYLIDHSTFSYLVFPETGFAEFFRRDLTPDELADQLQCFVEKAG